MNRQNRKQYIAFFLLTILTLTLGACTAHAALPAETDPPPTVQASVAPPAVAPEASVTEKPVETPPPPTEKPVETVPPEEPPAPAGPDLEEQPRMDDEFFADAAFLGNSLMRGLELWGKLPTADYYAVTSATVTSVDTAKNFDLPDGTKATQLDALCAREYGKVYILLGVNEIAFPTDYFIGLYAGILDKLAEAEPGAEIYIMSLSPVTARKSADGSPYTEEKVLEYNAALYALAAERGCWYVDNIDALAGEDGYLPPDYAQEDGVHLWPSKYPLWADYLRTHYAPETKPEV